jgi:hypothetical protein
MGESKEVRTDISVLGPGVIGEVAAKAFADKKALGAAEILGPGALGLATISGQPIAPKLVEKPGVVTERTAPAASATTEPDDPEAESLPPVVDRISELPTIVKAADLPDLLAMHPEWARALLDRELMRVPEPRRTALTAFLDFETARTDRMPDADVIRDLNTRLGL